MINWIKGLLKTEEGQWAVFGMGVIVVIVSIAMFTMSIKFVGAGEALVKFNRFTGSTKVTLRQGLNVVFPVTTKAKRYNLKMDVSDFPLIDGMSADNQTIKLHITINWKYQPDHLVDIYQKIIGNVEDTVMHNIVNETVKASLGKVQINDIAKNREGLRKDMEQTLRARMTEYFVDVMNLSITNVDYSEEFEKAVEAKQVAQQQAQAAEYNKQAKIREAEGQAQSNKLMQQTASQLVLKQQWIQKWDGKLPNVITGSQTGLMIDMRE